MRIAIFSDIHGNLQAFEAILNDIKSKKINEIICLGDLIGLGPSSNECLKLLYKNNIKYIMGNHELYYTRGLDVGHIDNPEILFHNKWVHRSITHSIDDTLLKYELNINSKKLLFFHYFLAHNKYPYESSSIFNDDRYKDIFKQYDYDYVFYGHRHMQRIDNFDNKTFYGLDSSGCTKDDKTFYYIVDVGNKVKIDKVIIKYDRDKFLKIMEGIHYPNKDHIAQYFFGIKNAK